MLHGYCVRRAGDHGWHPGIPGVDGVRVEQVEAAGLTMWVSEAAEGRPTPDRLREHERVVREALRFATPLPLRYGSRFGDAAAAASLLHERRAEFEEALQRIAGRVEMGLRIERAGTAEPAAGSPEPPAARGAEGGPGRAFLERRRAALQSGDRALAEAERELAEVDAFFAPLDLPSVRQPLAPPLVGSVAHLVHRSELRPYRRCVDELRRERPDLRIALSGPWGPYSFV